MKKTKSRKPVSRTASVAPARRGGPAIPAAIRPGLTASVEREVPLEWTLAHFNPNLPLVFSTPAMIGMMELAASQAVQPGLTPGTITVGTRIEVDHLKAVPAGARVQASARLQKIAGRFLAFAVEARSGDQLIGRGRVFRAIVEPKGFTAQAHQRTRKSAE